MAARTVSRSHGKREAEAKAGQDNAGPADFSGLIRLVGHAFSRPRGRRRPGSFPVGSYAKRNATASVSRIAQVSRPP